MQKEFVKIKKNGYGILHIGKMGAFLIMPLKASCDLAKIGTKAHGKKKVAKKKK